MSLGAVYRFFKFGTGALMVAGEMEGNSKQGLGNRDGARVRQSGRNDGATPRESQCGLKMPHAFMKDVHPAQQLELIGDIITLFGNRETPVQGYTCQLAIAEREHQR